MKDCSVQLIYKIMSITFTYFSLYSFSSALLGVHFDLVFNINSCDANAVLMVIRCQYQPVPES